MVALAVLALCILCFISVFLPNKVPIILTSSLSSEPMIRFSSLSTFVTSSNCFTTVSIIFFPSVIFSCFPITVVSSANNDISNRVLLASELKLFFKCLDGSEWPVIYRHPTPTSRSLSLASSLSLLFRYSNHLLMENLKNLVHPSLNPLCEIYSVLSSSCPFTLYDAYSCRSFSLRMVLLGSTYLLRIAHNICLFTRGYAFLKSSKIA